MKKYAIFGALPALALLVLAGCQQGNQTPTSTGGKLTLEKPSDLTLHQGDVGTVKVTIKRNNYSDPVKIAFDGLPDGVSVTSKDMTIPKDKNEGSFNFKADDTAKVGDKEVKVIAGEGDHKVDKTFKVTVKEKGK